MAEPQGPADVPSAGVPIFKDVMLKWRLIVDKGRKAGHAFAQPDLIIDATAVQHGLTVDRRDATDLERA